MARESSFLERTESGVVCCDTSGNTDSSVGLSQDMDGPDGFDECLSWDMQDWSDSQQVGDLVEDFSEACRLVGIYSEMAEVLTCPAKDWISAHQQADLVNIFLQGMAEASSISILSPLHSS